MPTLFGLDAEDIGDIAREAFHDCNDVGGPNWPAVGKLILDELLTIQRFGNAADFAAEAETRKRDHAKAMLAHLEGQR